MSRRPTIVDVARAAGVSKSTVSLVLQDSKAIRPETSALVRKAIDDIGYVYNRAAANMRTSSGGMIGLVINDLRNPFFAEFATSLQMALSAQDYAVFVANTGEDPELQAQMVGAMIEHGVSALVISPVYGGPAAPFDALIKARIPTMQVLRRLSSHGAAFPFASPDYRDGGRLATRHLLDAGARRIAFVGGVDGRDVTRERMSGYLEVLAEAGMRPTVLPGLASRAFGRNAAQVLAQSHPEVDAALCFNDLAALGILAGCAQIGRQVGPGFRVVGFDDIEDCADCYPTLSSVRCDIAGFGEQIAATVLDWLQTGSDPAGDLRRPVELVVRGSSL